MIYAPPAVFVRGRGGFAMLFTYIIYAHIDSPIRKS